MQHLEKPERFSSQANHWRSLNLTIPSKGHQQNCHAMIVLKAPGCLPGLSVPKWSNVSWKFHQEWIPMGIPTFPHGKKTDHSNVCSQYLRRNQRKRRQFDDKGCLSSPLWGKSPSSSRIPTLLDTMLLLDRNHHSPYPPSGHNEVLSRWKSHKKKWSVWIY